MLIAAADQLLCVRAWRASGGTPFPASGGPCLRPCPGGAAQPRLLPRGLPDPPSLMPGLSLLTGYQSCCPPSSFNKTKVIFLSLSFCHVSEVPGWGSKRLCNAEESGKFWPSHLLLHFSCLLSLISQFIISRRWHYLNVVLSNLLIMARMIFLCKY